MISIRDACTYPAPKWNLPLTEKHVVRDSYSGHEMETLFRCSVKFTAETIGKKKNHQAGNPPPQLDSSLVHTVHPLSFWLLPGTAMATMERVVVASSPLSLNPAL